MGDIKSYMVEYVPGEGHWFRSEDGSFLHDSIDFDGKLVVLKTDHDKKFSELFSENEKFKNRYENYRENTEAVNNFFNKKIDDLIHLLGISLETIEFLAPEAERFTNLKREILSKIEKTDGFKVISSKLIPKHEACILNEKNEIIKVIKFGE